MSQPFACTHTPDFPDLLARLNCSVALSTYQAGKVIFIGGREGRLVQLPRTFRKPMGMTIQGDRMAVATKDEVVLLGASRALAPGYPAKPQTYDTLFVPTQVFFTGECDLHDMAFIGAPGSDPSRRTELIAVNTRFSCLCRFDSRFHFQPVWSPPFITDLVDEDRCHLNGMAISEGGSRPVYVPALGAPNTERGWRDSRLGGGVLMDVASGEIVLAVSPVAEAGVERRSRLAAKLRVRADAEPFEPASFIDQFADDLPAEDEPVSPPEPIAVAEPAGPLAGPGSDDDESSDEQIVLMR